LPPLKKVKSIDLKVAKEKVSNSYDEDGVTIFARNFRKLMNSKKFRNKKAKFSDIAKGDSKGSDLENVDSNKKDSRGPKCFKCSGYGHMRANCGNLNKSKGNAYNTTLSDDPDNEETPGKDSNYLIFATSYGSPHESNDYYSENRESEDQKNKLQKVYNKLYVKFMELREVNQIM